MSKRYYWLKLKEDFFEDDTIAWLEEQKNGKDYIIFYLKLALKSLTNDGKLIRYVGNKLIPYDINSIAKLTNTDADTVAIALNLFLKIGLIEELDSGEIYMSQLNELVGSETDVAKRVRKHRLLKGQEQELLQCNDDVTKCNNSIEYRDKSLEKDIKDKKGVSDPKVKKENILDKTYFENIKVNELFIDFLAIRKKLKAQNTDRAITILLNKLKDLDDDAKIETINRSIENSWKGLFPKENKKDDKKYDNKFDKFVI